MIGERSAKPTSPFLTIEECAAIARAPVSSVRRWTSKGLLPSRRPARRVLILKAGFAAFMGLPVESLLGKDDDKP